MPPKLGRAPRKMKTRQMECKACDEPTYLFQRVFSIVDGVPMPPECVCLKCVEMFEKEFPPRRRHQRIGLIIGKPFWAISGHYIDRLGTHLH